MTPTVRSFHLSVENLIALAELLDNLEAAKALRRLPTSFSTKLGHAISPPLHKFFVPHEMKDLLDLVSEATQVIETCRGATDFT